MLHYDHVDAVRQVPAKLFHGPQHGSLRSTGPHEGRSRTKAFLTREPGRLVQNCSLPGRLRPPWGQR